MEKSRVEHVGAKTTKKYTHIATLTQTTGRRRKKAAQHSTSKERGESKKSVVCVDVLLLRGAMHIHEHDDDGREKREKLYVFVDGFARIRRNIVKFFCCRLLLILVFVSERSSNNNKNSKPEKKNLRGKKEEN